MADTTPTTAQKEALSLAFRDRLKKISNAGDTQDRTQKIMLALGYALQLTPTGNPGFTRTTTHKGKEVYVWVADAALTIWPSSLLSPIWVGYYSLDAANEMLDDCEYPRLMDYLLEFHPEAFSTSSSETLSDGSANSSGSSSGSFSGN